MKKFVSTIAVVVMAGAMSFAGVSKATYHYALKPAAKASFAVAKPIAKGSFAVAKPVAKGASFPARHPKHSVKAIKRVLY